MDNQSDFSGSDATGGFDPYHKWLGIHPSEQQPHFYRLLGIAPFESDPDVISNAADARMGHIKTFHAGRHSVLSQRILNEVATAKVCLLTPPKKAAYDRQLRDRLDVADCYELQQPAADEPEHPLASLVIDTGRPTVSTRKYAKKSRDPFTVFCLAGTAVALIAAVVIVLVVSAQRNNTPSNKPVARSSVKQPAERSPRPTNIRSRQPTPTRPAATQKEKRSQPSKQPGKACPVEAEPAIGRNVTPQLSLPDLVEMIEPSIVVIETDNDSGGRATGSGFVIDSKGLIVTNYHVIDDARNATARFSNDTIVKIAGYVAVAPGYDLALLRATHNGNIKFKPLGIRPDLPRKGEQVVAFGTPQGFDFSTTNGSVSAVRNGSQISDTFVKMLGFDLYQALNYNPDATWIQTDAAISAGNSGGPLIDLQGRVVGVNTWTRPPLGREKQVQNLNFAVSALAIGNLLHSPMADALPLSSLPRPQAPSHAVASAGNFSRPPQTTPKIASQPLEITLPSGALLNEQMLEIPARWQYKYFPDDATVYTAAWPNGDIRGIFTLDKAKLDGYAISLDEKGHFQTLAFYIDARLDGRMIQWDENGELLLYAEHRRGNKHGLFCYCREGLPWLIQEWDKNNKTHEYLVQFVGAAPKLIDNDQMTDDQQADFNNAASKLAILESTLADNEAELKRDLAKWYRKESKRLRQERVSRLAPEKRRRILNQIDANNSARSRGFNDKLNRIKRGNY